MLNFFAFQWGYQMGIDGALKMQITDDFSARGNVAWGRCKANGLQSGNYLLDTKEITDINTCGRRILRPLADNHQFSGGGLSVPRADHHFGTMLYGQACGPRQAKMRSPTLRTSVMDHLQCLNYPCIHSALG